WVSLHRNSGSPSTPKILLDILGQLFRAGGVEAKLRSPAQEQRLEVRVALQALRHVRQIGASFAARGMACSIFRPRAFLRPGADKPLRAFLGFGRKAAPLTCCSTALGRPSRLALLHLGDRARGPPFGRLAGERLALPERFSQFARAPGAQRIERLPSAAVIRERMRRLLAALAPDLDNFLGKARKAFDRLLELAAR